jgi:VCBS repeat-containing protein
MRISYTVEDADGDQATGHIQVDINDDGPAILGSSSLGSNLLVNGDLTTGTWPNPQSWGNWAVEDIGWKVEGTADGQSGVRLERVSSGYLGLTSSNGSPMIDLGASPGNVAISQTLTGLVAGKSYDLSFEVGSPSPGSAGLQVYWNGVPVSPVPVTGTMQVVALSVVSNGSEGVLTFKEIGNAADNTGTFLANISLQPTDAVATVVDTAVMSEDNTHIVPFVEGVDFEFGADDGSIVIGTPTVSTIANITLQPGAVTYVAGSGFQIVGSAFDALGEGEIAKVTIPYKVVDGDDDAVAGTVVVTVIGTNDAPVITSSYLGTITESGDLLGINEAGVTGALEPTAAPSAQLGFALTSLLTNPADIVTVLAAAKAELGGDEAKAIATVWDYLDDIYSSAGPNQPNVNEAFTRLGVEYAKYLQAGGQPLVDVTAKYSVDTNSNGIPQRLQSLHDNLLGNLGDAALKQRYVDGSMKYNEMKALVVLSDPDLLDRPYYDGGEANTAAAAASKAWDAANGYDASISGQLAVTDPDIGDSHVWALDSDPAGLFGTFAVNSAGQWTYTLDNASSATQALEQGEERIETFTVKVMDESGATDLQEVTVKIVGANDAPVIIQSDAVPYVAQGLSGFVEADDALDGKFEPAMDLDTEIVGLIAPGMDMEAILAAVQNALGSGATRAMAIAQVWDYVDDNFDYYNNLINEVGAKLGIEYAKYLNEGGSPLLNVVAKYAADDVDAGSAPNRLQSLHDNLLGNLNNVGLFDKLVQSNTNPAPAVYQEILALLDANGLSDLLVRPVFSGTEGEVNSSLAWDQAHGYVSGASGQIMATDIDQPAGTPLAWSGDMVGTYGDFKIDPATGKWTYEVDHMRPATLALSEGQTVVETFTVTVADKFNAIDTVAVNVTITGTNDAPVISIDESEGDSAGAELPEANVGLTATGTLTVTDVDVADVVTTSVTFLEVSGPDYGTNLNHLDLNSYFKVTPGTVIDGSQPSGSLTWEFDSENQAFDFLAANTRLVLKYTVTVTDSSGAKDTQIVEIGINGTNDAPVISGVDATLAYSEGDGALVIDGDLTVTDVDDARLESATVAITGNYSSEDFLNFNNTSATTFGNITGSYNDAGELTLTSADGSATKAQFEAALEAVTYENTSQNPTTQPRTVSYSVFDGDVSSNVGTATINVTAVADGNITWSPYSTLNENGPQSGANLGKFTYNFLEPGQTFHLDPTSSAGFTVGADGVIKVASNTTLADNPTYEIKIDVKDGSTVVYSETFNVLMGSGSADDPVRAETDVVLQGDDVIYGLNGSDTLYGGAGDDILLGQAASDVLIGGAGNDNLYGGGANDTFEWGDEALSSMNADRILQFNQNDRIDLSSLFTQPVNANSVVKVFISGSDLLVKVDAGSGFVTAYTLVGASSVTGVKVTVGGPEVTLTPIAAADPIILDLDKNGFALSSIADGVTFDINADGKADQIAWTSDDGILAYDVDGNGVIDNGSEVFTPDFNGGTFASGMAALASLDGNGDGKIDGGDAAFDELKVWIDANNNGISDEGELSSLSDHDVASISLTTDQTGGEEDGQTIFAEGEFTFEDGSTGNFVEVGFDTIFGSEPEGLTLYGGMGEVVMTGSAGADTFVFDGTALDDLDVADVITDFSSDEGDVLDVTALLDSLLGEQPDATVETHLRATVDDGNTTVSVQTDANVWKDVVVLQNHDTAIKVLFDDQHATVTPTHND